MTTRQTPDAVREAIREDIAKQLDEPWRDRVILRPEQWQVVLAALDSRAGDAGEGKTDSEIIAFANRFYDPADNGSGADIRKWIKAVRAALSSTPAPAVDAVPAGEVEQ